MRILRANATLATEAGQHALRLAATAGLAELVSDAARLQYGRWAVLTTFLVLKPDYASTVTRSVQRAFGTLVGVGLTLLFIILLRPAAAGTGAAALVAVALSYVLFDVNFMLFSVFLTAFVVLVLDLVGWHALSTAEGRLTATAAGALWAMLVYLAWPSWERASAPEKLALLIERQGAYLLALLEQLAQPAGLDPKVLRSLQDSAWRARSEAEQAADRIAHEPVAPPFTPELARTLMALFGRLALGLLATQTLLDRSVTQREPTTAVHLLALAGAFRTAMQRLAQALRTKSRPGPMPALRELQVALVQQGRCDPSLQMVTDALVDTVGSIGAVLDARLGTRPVEVPGVERPPAQGGLRREGGQ